MEREGEEVAEIVDQATGEATDWGGIFFRLHHYCHLSKWQIYEYTLPQITELMKHTNKHIQFQIKVVQAPLMAMFGGGGGEEDGDYSEIDDEGLSLLAGVLSGN